MELAGYLHVIREAPTFYEKGGKYLRVVHVSAGASSLKLTLEDGTSVEDRERRLKGEAETMFVFREPTPQNDPARFVTPEVVVKAP